MSASTLADLAAALAGGAVRVVDLTQPLSERTPVLQLPEPFVNTPGLSRRELSRYDERGPGVGVERAGDRRARRHALRRADPLDHGPRRRGRRERRRRARLVGPAVVIDKSAEAAADPGLPADGRRRARVRGRARRRCPRAAGCCCARAGTPARTTRTRSSTAARTPGPDAECARWLAQETPIVGIGVETVGTDAGAAGGFDPPFPVHATSSARASTASRSSPTSRELPPAGALVVVAPLKLVGGTGSPARVLAFVP